MGGGIIKVTEPKLHNLCIYSSPGKQRNKRSGNFPGHWPNPHSEEACYEEDRREETASSYRGRTGEDDFGRRTHAGAFEPCARAQATSGRASLRGSRLFLCERERARRVLCAHAGVRLRLMTLKGQMPLTKINGGSWARGNGLPAPDGRICKATVITATKQTASSDHKRRRG